MPLQSRIQPFPSICIALALLCVTLVSVFPASSTQSATASQVEQGRVLFTVVDKESHFIGTLQTSDLRLFADDKPQEIIALRRLEDQQLSLAIMIDTSVSQERTLPALKFAADAFVQTIMRQGKDQATVISFAGTATVDQDLTKDTALLRKAIASVRLNPGYLDLLGTKAGQAASATALWDAIWATSDELMPPIPGTRKAIILLSDGDDTISKVKRKDAIEHTVQANIAVYALGVGDNQMYDGVDKGALKELTEQTGGRAFRPKKTKDLERALTEIQQELSTQYEITYRSSGGKAGSPRKLRLEIINPALRANELQISYQRIGVGPSK